MTNKLPPGTPIRVSSEAEIDELRDKYSEPKPKPEPKLHKKFCKLNYTSWNHCPFSCRCTQCRYYLWGKK